MYQSFDQIKSINQSIDHLMYEIARLPRRQRVVIVVGLELGRVGAVGGHVAVDVAVARRQRVRRRVVGDRRRATVITSIDRSIDQPPTDGLGSRTGSL